MSKVLTRLIRIGFTRGVLRGQPAWMAFGGVALVVHLTRKAFARKTDVVFLEEVEPGESFLVTNRKRS